MVKVFYSCVLEAPVATVWDTVKNFEEIAAWHPGLATSKLEGEGANAYTIGVVRHLSLEGSDGFVRETLLAFDENKHTFTYNIIESSMPVQNYVATLSLFPVTEGDKTYAVWEAEFDTPDADAIAPVIFGVFSSGLQNVASLLKQ